MKTCHFLVCIFAFTSFSHLTAQVQDISMNGQISSPVYSLSLPIEGQTTSEKNHLILTKSAAFLSTKEYPDLHSFVQSTLTFPEEGRHTGRYGKVKVLFDILPSGDIGEIRFLESPHPVYEKEVLRILQSMPAWAPAYSDSTPVRSQYQLTLNFTLQ